MPSKSVFRQPGAKHFQLVHRSQRDPLIHDPDASQHVLKPFERENVKKGKSRADLESTLPATELTYDQQANIGEAALYGIYYNDTEYNYMQHLRQVGVQEDGVESMLIEASLTPKQHKKDKSSKGAPISLRDLPQEVLASTSELPRTYESQQAVPESIAGFQPDMDPHLRQALEALEDEAFVDDELEDDFFGELVGDGERGGDEVVEFVFEEEGVEDGEERSGEEGAEEEVEEQAGWEVRFARFQKARQGMDREGSEGGYESEGGDTIGGLPEMSVIGGKKRRKGTSDASGYSMSSSSMYRNEALQTLDERFDQIILKEYNEDSDSGSQENTGADLDNNSDDTPELITTREDFESMVDEFINDYEILGRKMKLKLAGDSGAEKLDTLRRAMGQDERITRLLMDSDEDNVDDQGLLMPVEVQDRKDRWDCETILTTYSNLENHPRLIRARDPRPVPKIVLDRRTGLPTVLDTSELNTRAKPNSKFRGNVESSEQDDGGENEDETGDLLHYSQTTRPRDESKEAKKARKAAVKAARQARRVDKKATKELFGAELKTQMRAVGNKERRIKTL